MNPFDQLVRHAARQASTKTCSFPQEHTGKTGHMFSLLSQHGALTTRELASKAGLDQTRLVWGLMKYPRSNGQVRFHNGMWSLSRPCHQARIKQAAELLRQHGWVCTPPQGC